MKVLLSNQVSIITHFVLFSNQTVRVLSLVRNLSLLAYQFFSLHVYILADGIVLVTVLPWT